MEKVTMFDPSEIQAVAIEVNGRRLVYDRESTGGANLFLEIGKFSVGISSLHYKKIEGEEFLPFDDKNLNAFLDYNENEPDPL